MLLQWEDVGPTFKTFSFLIKDCQRFALRVLTAVTAATWCLGLSRMTFVPPDVDVAV